VVSVYVTRKSTLVVYREAHDLSPSSIKALLAKAGQFISVFEQLLADAKRFGDAESRLLVSNIVTYVPTVIANRAWNLRNRVSRDRMITETTAFIMRGLGFNESDGVIASPARKVPRTGKSE
jgi:hypothetical protein